jgi:polysaccharide pyruvyl transferase WcaK-like protein
MKIGLLTLPLTWNYGGILQAYAINHILREKEFDVVLLDKRRDRGWVVKALVSIKWKAVRIIGKISPLKKKGKLLAVEKFKRDYFQTEYLLFNEDQLVEACQKNNIDCLIVGSDQVWNRDSMPGFKEYFLDFDGKIKVKKIAFAASTGHLVQNYTPNELKIISKSLKNFDLISVRELFTAKLFQRNFNVNVEFFPDPTLFLNRSTYVNLISENSKLAKENYLLCYILDPQKETPIKIRSLCKKLELPMLDFNNEGKNNSVENWIQAFNDCKFVVTDSYHGMIFSIIFNKPFLVLKNNKRGAERFNSLATKLNLNCRVVDNIPGSLDNIEKIDWESTNKVLREWVVDSKLKFDKSLTSQFKTTKC